jgi:hypothetical protein
MRKKTAKYFVEITEMDEFSAQSDMLKTEIYNRSQQYLINNQLDINQKSRIEFYLSDFKDRFESFISSLDGNIELGSAGNSAIVAAFRLGLLIADPSLVDSKISTIAQKKHKSLSVAGKRGFEKGYSKRLNNKVAWEGEVLNRARTRLSKNSTLTFTEIAREVADSEINNILIPGFESVKKYLTKCKKAGLF